MQSPVMVAYGVLPQSLEKLIRFSFTFLGIRKASLAGNSRTLNERIKGRQSGHVLITTHSFAKNECLGSPSQTLNYPRHHLPCLSTATLPSQGNTLQTRISCTQSFSKRKEWPRLIAQATNVRSNN